MRRLVCAVLGIALTGWRVVAAADTPQRIEVFTMSRVPIANAKGAEVHVVDALQTLTRALSRDLPKVPSDAKDLVLTRMQSSKPNFHERARRAVLALTRAAQLHIDRIPAVVFDEKWVVYGLSDVNAARNQLRRIDVTKSVPRKR